MQGFASQAGETLPSIIFFAVGVYFIVSSVRLLSRKNEEEKSIFSKYGLVISLAYAIIIFVTPNPSIWLNLLMYLSILSGILFKLITWGIVKARNQRQH